MGLVEVRDGLRLYCQVRGQGQPVVLVHALSMTHELWQNQLLGLAGAYRVYAYDQRGHGQSDKPEGPYDVRTYTDDLHALLTTLDLHDVVLVGCSIGSWVAVDYMDRYAERVGKVVLSGCTPQLMRKPDWEHGAPEEMFAALFGQLMHDRGTATEAFYKSMMNPGTSRQMLDWIVRMSFTMPLFAYLESGQSVASTDMRAVLGRVRVPTLVINGHYDQAIPLAISDYLAASLPDGRAVVFANSGHFACVEEPEAFNQAVAAFIEG